MIDGIKFECNYLQPETWLQNDLLMFPIPVNNHTGEIIRDTITAKHNGLKFKITPSPREPEKNYCNVEGSLHRYHNNGGDNSNDYTAADIQSTIDDLAQKFCIDPAKSIIHNLEFGVNISLPIPADQFIKSIVSLPDKRFSDMSIEKINLGKVCHRSEYDTKIYNKGKQTGQPVDNLVRIEIKVTKMRWLHSKVNIITLEDLSNPENLTKLGQLLLETFADVIVYQNNLSHKLLTNRERILIRDFRNPDYWQALNFKQRYKKRKAFNVLLMKYDAPNIRSEVSLLIGQKWGQLNPKTEHGAAVKVAMFSPLEYGVKTSPNEGDRVHGKTYLNERISILPEIETAPAPISPGEKRFCKICGRDISGQKAGSLFCSEKFHGKKAKRCRNTASGQARTERNRQARELEALQLKKLYLIDRNTIKAISYTTNDNSNHRRQVSKLHLSKKEIRKVVFVKIAGFEFTTLRAKAVIKYLIYGIQQKE